VIITTYSDSPYLAMSKLAIADTFYLEGTTSNLIQAGAAYRDWLTFFPTHPLADEVSLKLAEVEMRQMGLPDRDATHARKAEQQLKVVLQQYPKTQLKSEVELRLKEVQENLAMHNLQVANFYLDRFNNGKASNPKGAQSRLREIVEKYPNFSYLDETLFKLGMTYMLEEEPDEAAKYFQRIVREYPNSEYVEKAREQLNVIGAPVPEPDPKRMETAPPPRPSMTQKIFREILGTTPVTVVKDGVIISRGKEANDLIEVALKNGGQLPANVTTPQAPVRRATEEPQPLTAPKAGAASDNALPSGQTNSEGRTTGRSVTGIRAPVSPAPAGTKPEQ
jgi:outer membrane protein assembly factor BamD